MEGSLVADRLSRLGLSAGQSGAAADGGVLQLRENEELLGERPSVGLSVGTLAWGRGVGPNVTFRNILMDNTFKGIYVKMDNNGHRVQDLLYQNITIRGPTVEAPVMIGPINQFSQ